MTERRLNEAETIDSSNQTCVYKLYRPGFFSDDAIFPWISESIDGAKDYIIYQDARPLIEEFGQKEATRALEIYSRLSCRYGNKMVTSFRNLLGLFEVYLTPKLPVYDEAENCTGLVSPYVPGKTFLDYEPANMEETLLLKKGFLRIQDLLQREIFVTNLDTLNVKILDSASNELPSELQANNPNLRKIILIVTDLQHQIGEGIIY